MKRQRTNWRASRTTAARANGLDALVAMVTMVAPILLAALVAPAALLASGLDVWADVSEPRISSPGERRIIPAHYRTVALDAVALDAVLQAAPLESSANALIANAVINLPLPDGADGRFRIVESPIMAPELATKFPELRTFRGQGVDDPTATVRFDRTPAGFHAMILSVAGTVYIDPFSRGDAVHHISYFARDQVEPEAAEAFRCGVSDEESQPKRGIVIEDVPDRSSGATLKTYRVAVAATGEYTAYHSKGAPTVAEGMAAIVTTMNLVNGIFERDVAVRMTLVANNDLIVHTDSATDPYTNHDKYQMIYENQTHLDAIIGDLNYDLGHVFSTAGGGVASLRVPCQSRRKARGVTGLRFPTGSIWIDYVAHELGHQWGANHTFNGDERSCAGNRSAYTAYEPGSGTTIMSYAYLCGSQNIQYRADDQFHNVSYQEISDYVTFGYGDTCDAPTATGNTPPTADAGSSFTIPISTPFELCGSATDPDGDTLTYSWEQLNRGPAGHPNSPVANAPIFRVFPPTLSNCRTFPQVSDLLDNTQTLGELLPSYARTLAFRMLVRDNRGGGGGADFDRVDIDVSDGGGPFRVTVPNSAVTWTYPGTRTVTWDVAGTDRAPISCSQVDLLLSTDGGRSFPTTVLAATANDGTENILVPRVDSTEARLQVRCSDNIFFDISDVDFTIWDDHDPQRGPPDARLVYAATSATIPDGGSYEFGAWNASELPQIRRFLLCNEGERTLHISGPSVSGAGFFAHGQAPPASVSTSSCVQLWARFEATTPGDYIGSLSIASDDPDENPYNVAFSGSVNGASPEPVIALFEVIDGVETTTRVANYSTRDLGTGYPTVGTSQVFSVHNIGDADLVISSQDATGECFWHTGGPMTVASGAAVWVRTSFYCQEDHPPFGSLAGTLTVRSNDPVADPFELHLQAQLTANPNPRLWVKRVDGRVPTTPIFDQNTIDLGNTATGAPISKRFEIKNLGASVLTLTDPSSLVSGQCFSQIENPASSIPAGGVAYFRVRLHCNATGTWIGQVTVPSNDPDRPAGTLEFFVRGTVTSGVAVNAGPELDPNG